MAQWLLKIKPDIEISMDNEYIFRYTCDNGHLEVAKWLLSVKPDIDISARDEYAFKGACENGHLNLAKWLLSVKPDIDISARDEYAFRYACENGHLKIAQWLGTFNKNYVIIIEEDEITEFYVIKQLIINKYKKIEDQVEDCLICYEPANVITSCNHQYCKSCLDILYSKGISECSYCRQQMGKLYNIKI